MDKVNIDKIIESIKNEVVSRKPIDSYKNILSEMKVNNFKFSDYLNNNKFNKKDFYVIQDFLNYKGDDFIQSIYVRLLNRKANTQEIDLWKQKLLSKQLNKIEVIGRIRYGKEGRKQKEKIKGLLPKFIINSINKIPVLGYLLKILIDIVLLPKKISNLEHNELINEFEENNVIKKIDSLENKINEEILVKNKLTEYEKYIFYKFAFDDEIRGSNELIRNRMLVYLPNIEYLKSIKNPVIYDIGSGRGEWIKLLKEKNIDAIGVDLNCDILKELGYNDYPLINEDATEFVINLDNNSCDLITAFHVIEHMEFENLLKFLINLHRVLKPDSIAILETPNPENTIVGATAFYRDFTHKNPLHPESLKILCEKIGFEVLKTDRLNPCYIGDLNYDDLLNNVVSSFVVGGDYSLILRK